MAVLPLHFAPVRVTITDFLAACVSCWTRHARCTIGRSPSAKQHAQESEPTMSKNLGKAEQALYERLRMGPLNAGEASFFSRQIGALIAARIARRTQEGGVELVNPASYATAPPPASLSSAPPASQSGEHSVMPTVTARVPQDVIDYADTIREPNESRGSALRRLLGAAVERGLCKPATLRKAGGAS